MTVVTAHQAKANLSRLIKKASQGEEVMLPAGLRLSPGSIGEAKGKRQPGSLKGKLRVGSEFFEPLPASELSRWG